VTRHPALIVRPKVTDSPTAHRPGLAL